MTITHVKTISREILPLLEEYSPHFQGNSYNSFALLKAEVKEYQQTYFDYYRLVVSQPAINKLVVQFYDRHSKVLPLEYTADKIEQCKVYVSKPSFLDDANNVAKLISDKY